jgi:hypothetical protein
LGGPGQVIVELQMQHAFGFDSFMKIGSPGYTSETADPTPFTPPRSAHGSRLARLLGR